MVFAHTHMSEDLRGCRTWPGSAAEVFINCLLTRLATGSTLCARLATSAISAAVKKRMSCAVRHLQPLEPFRPLPCLIEQRLTQIPLTEVSTLIDQKIPGN